MVSDGASDLSRDTARTFGLASRILLAYFDDDMAQVAALVNPRPQEAVEALIILAQSAMVQATGGPAEAMAKLREFAVRAEIQLGENYPDCHL
ncbi:hypothetical protein GA0070608_5194 [Micromonospora peucetia]|uniref:Uncharacterized protein n=1 Tax=Micromonospora peucetia TaxID=47871 RepID=A0A1C6W2P7_9ACTN|nr:hypothetical protein GA0070608_5194 [Micromonospora peucetia]